MFRLNRTASILAAPVVAALFSLTPIPAADHSSEKRPKDLTVVGCVVQEGPKQYEIKGQDKTYLLESRRYKLSKYVGQEVSVSGGIAKKGSQGDMARFKVSSLSRVSKKSCS
jgi:hypothetical protein